MILTLSLYGGLHISITGVTMIPMKKIAIFILIAGSVVFGGASYAAEDRTFDDVAEAVINKFDGYLIDEGYCRDSNECRKNKIIFFGPRSDGFDISVYGVTDRRLINKVVSLCLDEQLTRKFNFSVRIYPLSKEQDLARPIWKKSSYAEFTYKWGQNEHIQRRSAW